MINLFDIPADDQSIFYLGQIFGYMTGVLPAANAPMTLGTMFKVFNSIILVVGVLVIIYVTVVGVMKTAHEGEFMGKQWNNIWIPIRMVIGIAALVPSASGYSAIQIVMMWVILQGIGAADTIWTTVLKYKEAFGSLTAPISIPSADAQIYMQSLFYAMTCQATMHANYKYGGDSTSLGYYCNSNPGDSFCQLREDETSLYNIRGSQSTISTNQITYNIGPGGSCGTLIFCNQDTACKDQSTPTQQTACNVCKTSTETLQSIVAVFGAIGKDLTDTDYQYRYWTKNPDQDKTPQFVKDYCSAQGWDPKENCCPQSNSFLGNPNCKLSLSPDDMSNSPPTTTTQSMYWPYKIQPDLVGNIDFIGASTATYTGNVTSVANQNTVQNTTISDTTLQEAQRLGWIFAGAYYYTLSQGSANNITAILPVFTATPSNPSDTYPAYRNNFTAASDLEGSASAASANQFSYTFPKKLSQLDKVGSSLNKTAGDMADAFMKAITGDVNPQTGLVTNPLVALQNLGKILLIVAQVLFGIVMVIVPLVGIIGNLDVFVVGTGATNPVGPVLNTLSVIFAPFFFLFLSGLFVYGSMLAIYVPLIPYIVFSLGAISWFILVIEAMVAAPILALGILAPSGHHEVLGKAEKGLMLLFGIFLRPGLMIFGMMAAMLLAIVGVSMINAGFKGVMGQIYQNPGLVETMIFLAAYIALVLAVLNKCFSLIHIVPDRVLRWIGEHTEETGAAGELADVKKGVEAGAAGVSAMGARAQARSEVAAKSIKGYHEHRKGQGSPNVTPGQGNQQNQPPSTPPSSGGKK